MARIAQTIDVAAFREILAYNADSGALTWKARPITMFHAESPSRLLNAWSSWNTKYAGKVAGTLSPQSKKRGNVPRAMSVWFRHSAYGAHRIIWEMEKGPIPVGMFIDHVNGNPLDNRLCNLRLATQAQNAQNSKVRKDSASRIKGVRWNAPCQKWMAIISLKGKSVYLGLHATKGLAALAHAKESIRHYGAFSPVLSRR